MGPPTLPQSQRSRAALNWEPLPRTEARRGREWAAQGVSAEETAPCSPSSGQGLSEPEHRRESATLARLTDTPVQPSTCEADRCPDACLRGAFPS